MQKHSHHRVCPMIRNAAMASLAHQVASASNVDPYRITLKASDLQVIPSGSAAVNGPAPFTPPDATVGLVGLRAACIHEYAHGAVARHFGARGIVGIRREPRSADGKHNYTGSFSLIGPLSARKTTLVWLAGSVAELVDTQLGISPTGVMLAFEQRSVALSRADLQGAGAFRRHHVVECACLVGSLWSRILELTAGKMHIEQGGVATEAEIIATCLT